MGFTLRDHLERFLPEEFKPQSEPHFSIDSTAHEQSGDKIEGCATNYKGQWSTLSGALNTPASVWHNGAYWGLLSNIANVATAQPGVSSAWAAVGTQVHRLGLEAGAPIWVRVEPSAHRFALPTGTAAGA